MRKFFLLFTFSILLYQLSFSQGGVWTWISGDSTLNSLGVYGTQGIPSLNNHPPACYEACEWKDKQGNFWVYIGGSSAYCDLWKYNPLTNEWTWVKGTGLQHQSRVYGIKGVPNFANTPGERIWGSATCVDTAGNFWLFGSDIYKNDLWKYEISTNDWTWMNGDTIQSPSGVHGMQGVPSISNAPGGRSEACTAWCDSSNNIWLFGGYGYDDAGTHYYLNDLMKYNISTNEWTWMNGSALAGAGNNYGVKGVTNISNVPGSRCTYSQWKDVYGNFWFMGGKDNVCHNDVWKYDEGINEWTWMAGTNLPGDLGVYQNICVYDTNNTPASRMEQRSTVTDNCGRFWLFGGSIDNGANCLNDLWVFDPFQLQWNWISGTNVFNQQGNYGSLGVASLSNMPLSRIGSVSWWGNNNRFYLFGGYQSVTNSFLSDLWVFTPDTSCIGSCSCTAATPTLTQNADTLFVPNNYASYQWFYGSNPIIGATNYFYVATQSGNYNIEVTDSNGCSVGAGIINVIASLTPTLSKGEGVSVHPNPTTGKFVVTFYAEKNSLIVFELINSLGEIIFKEKKNCMQGANSLSFGEGWGEAGIYLLKITDGEKMITKKIVIE